MKITRLQAKQYQNATVQQNKGSKNLNQTVKSVDVHKILLKQKITLSLDENGADTKR